MIEINCKRNPDGFYLLDEIDSDQYFIYLNEKFAGSINYWCVPMKEKSFIMKSRKSNSYIYALFSELLVSQICKKNLIPCANIDIGIFKGDFVVLSEDVFDPDDERLDAKGLMELAGEEFVQNKFKIYENFYAEKLLEYAKRIQRIYSEIEIDPNFLNDLYKIAFIDIIVGQTDRNPTNLMFKIKRVGERRVLSVAPIFDNEFSLEAMRLGRMYDGLHINPITLIYSNEEEDYQLVEDFSEMAMNFSHFESPIFGTSMPLDLNIFNKNSSLNDAYKQFKETSLRNRTKAMRSMAKIIVNNKDLFNIYKNFDCDIFEIAKSIHKDLNFAVPESFMQMSQKIVENNYNQLKKYVEKEFKRREEKEINESGIVL